MNERQALSRSALVVQHLGPTMTDYCALCTNVNLDSRHQLEGVPQPGAFIPRMYDIPGLAYDITKPVIVRQFWPWFQVP